MPDGLGLLDEQRQRRTRTIPTPKNPPRSTPVDIVTLLPAVKEAEPTDRAQPAPKPPRPAAAVEPAGEPAAETAAKPVVQQPTIKMSIYLEHSDDLYLEDITHAGKISRSRVAISRSAIVRLALERLAATMTTAEIVAELRKSGGEHQGKGRKRR